MTSVFLKSWLLKLHASTFLTELIFYLVKTFCLHVLNVSFSIGSSGKCEEPSGCWGNSVQDAALIINTMIIVSAS